MLLDSMVADRWTDPVFLHAKVATSIITSLRSGMISLEMMDELQQLGKQLGYNAFDVCCCMLCVKFL